MTEDGQSSQLQDMQRELEFMKNAKIFEIPSWTSQQLQQTLIDMAPLYRDSNLNEIKVSTAYKGPVAGVEKTAKSCEEQQAKLI